MSTTSQQRVQPTMPEPTTRVRVSDADELDVWVMGEGEPVLLIHGAMTRDLLTPLADELVKPHGYQVIHYGRRGHGGRGLPGEAADIPGQVPDVIAILDALGIGQAHVAGHSFGGYITLDLALRAADRVRSAILREPVFGQQLQTEASLQAKKELEMLVPRVAEKYRGGDEDGAVRMLWYATSGIEGGSELIEAALPEGARQLAAADLGTCLQVDLPALGSWTVDPAAVQEATVPLVWIGGAESSAGFAESLALLQEWLPTTRAVLVEGAGHYFPILKPAETATAVAELVGSRIR